jgi:aerobic C4-dicarboxylate transport protein
MSTCTALTNMIGNTVAVFALAKWERAFDIERFRAYQRSSGELIAARDGPEPAPPHAAAAPTDVALAAHKPISE